MLYFAACVGVFASLPLLVNIPWYASFSLALLLYLLVGGLESIQIFLHCLPRDFKFMVAAIKITKFAKDIKQKNIMLYDYLIKQAKEHPNKPAYISAETGEQLTFKQANELANKVANYFYDQGYRQGDVVALMMENRIEYIPIWLGLSKIGVVTALINTNLKEKSLQHCIEIVSAKSLIYSKEMTESVKTVDLSIEKFYWDGDFSNLLESTCIKYVSNLVVSTLEPMNCVRNDTDSVYIYTSGTTGLPKAAVLKALRCVRYGYGFIAFVGGTENDICYNVLPLYHTSGLLVASNMCLQLGASMVLRKKFSASHFFKDCCKYECTFFIYIGEICRYLLAQPVTEYEKKHQLKFGTGNGLKASIWKEFQERFNLPVMKEFFGSTEGNTGFINMGGYQGAVGFFPLFLKPLKSIGLMEIDENTGQLKRGADGLGIQVKCGEPGMLVTKIDEKRNAGFDGYVNKKATEKKIAYDVISKGDSVFVFGDMLYTDKYGYFYFTDRLGDTFRWKGENVSTNEVEGVISKSLHLNDVCVYGVEINGIEGRAGMACIVDPERKVDVSKLSSLFAPMLPSYARPMFLRFSSHVSVTGTFKFQKVDLRNEGFDPKHCGNDELFYYNTKTKSYHSVDGEVYEEIQAGKMRF